MSPGKKQHHFVTGLINSNMDGWTTLISDCDTGAL